MFNRDWYWYAKVLYDYTNITPRPCNKPVGITVLSSSFCYFYTMSVKTSYRENISIALQSIAGNRLRTSLTALIIAIGIMALVGILTAIEGVKQFTNDAFAGLGANSFTIQTRGQGLRF